MTKPEPAEGLAESVKRLGRFADWLYWRATHTKALENGNRHGLLRTRLDPKHLAEAVKDIRTVLDALAAHQTWLSEHDDCYTKESHDAAVDYGLAQCNRADEAEAALRQANEQISALKEELRIATER